MQSRRLTPSGLALFFLTLLCPLSVICVKSRAATLDTLVVSVSEDAYLGDALFTVSVDKKKIGGNLTATALRAKGASQDFTLTGAWGPGPHVVTVRFLVDAYGGSAGKDRNLYVNSVTLRCPLRQHPRCRHRRLPRRPCQRRYSRPA